MSSVFLAFLVIHIVSGTVCLVTGLLALLVPKKRGKHTKFGETYHYSYVVLFVSAVVTSILHWSTDAYLFYIALFSYGLALLGYLARKKRWKNWLHPNRSQVRASASEVHTILACAGRLPAFFMAAML